ncbi:hypothetical protein LTR53_012428, partial [Teratosphaeriaceae sp. CCFEE 6253]
MKAEETVTATHPANNTLPMDTSPSTELSTEKHAKSAEPPIAYPTGSKLALILAAAGVAIFLVSLDMTIVSTAIPQITSDFHSLADVGWYGAGFFMTMAAFQAMWGKGYKYFAIKRVYLLAIV